MTPRTLLGRLQSLIRRGRRDQDLDEELRLHLDLASADFQRQGLSADQARRAARQQLGGIDRTREQVRDTGGFPWLDSFAQDLRYAVRMARRQPGFSAVVILSVALGIGANTAIFSLVDAVLVRPLAYPEPERLAVVRVVIPDLAATYPTLPANGLGFTLWRQQVWAFEELSAIEPVAHTLTGVGTPERVEAARVSANLFGMLGAPVVLGRDFRADEEREGQDGVVILSDAFWRARFGADPGVLGRRLALDGRPHVVVGVLGPGFRFPRSGQLGALVTLPPHTALFRPMAMTSTERTSAGDFDYAVIGRLRPGATTAEASAQVDVVQAEVARRSGLPIKIGSAVVPLQEQMVGPARRGLLVLAASVGAVLLLLCVNLASLLLARTSDRQRESAIRVALGASRARVLRQLMVENLLLAVAGGALGVVLAAGLLTVLATRLPVDLPRFDEVHLSSMGIAVAVLLSVATGMLFSVLPAMRLSAAPPHAALASGGRTASAGAGAARVRSALVTAEVALSTVLLVVAGLLVASFLRLLGVPKGFDTERVVLATVVPSPDKYENKDTRVAFFDRLLAQVRVLPGGEARAMVSYAPLRGEAQVRTLTTEHDTRPITARPAGNMRAVSPDYFQAIGIRLTRGRLFSESDRSRLVVIVNERTATTLWPGDDPIGKRMHVGDEEQPLQDVIGVVADTREVNLQRAPLLMSYVPYWGPHVPSGATLVLRTPQDVAVLAEPLRQAVWRVDPGLPAPDIRSLRQVVAQAVSPERFQMLLVGIFASGALLLAALGIYGVPAYAVSRRTQELGIRMALGAQPADLMRMVIRQGLTPVAIGLALGLAGALAAGRFVAGLLFDVTPYDPPTLGIVLLLVGAVAVIACYVPARRATRIDPMTALRFE